MTVRGHGGAPYPDREPKSATLEHEGRVARRVCSHDPGRAPADNGHAIGIDMNARQIATSDGTTSDGPGPVAALRTRPVRVTLRAKRTARVTGRPVRGKAGLNREILVPTERHCTHAGIPGAP